MNADGALPRAQGAALPAVEASLRSGAPDPQHLDDGFSPPQAQPAAAPQAGAAPALGAKSPF